MDELLYIADKLERLIARSKESAVQGPLQNLNRAASEVSRAWSGSWIGYQANVYHRDLQSPPPGVHFSIEWGKGATDDWLEYSPEHVITEIHRLAGNPSMAPVIDFNELASNEFSIQKNNLLSIVEIETRGSSSEFVMTKKEAISKLSLISELDYIDHQKPERVQSRDTLAIYQGVRVPPHVEVLAQVLSMQATIRGLKSLAEYARLLASHVRRDRDRQGRDDSAGDKVFIGHGHSPIWLELRDFLKNTLHIRVDEFNRVPTAGQTTVDRLEEMLESAAIAFLIMTGEDGQPDGGLRARENVVHEAGLFQGRLGFKRAIILLEDGCDEFSNIAGLGHVKFPKENIKAAFQDVRELLEREGVIESGATP